MAVNTAKQDFGVGTNDLYGVQEAERRRATAKEKAQTYAAEKYQDIFTETANKYQNSRAAWADKNKGARSVYEKQEYDFANATDLNDYYNDTAGAFGGGKRTGKFGNKDYEYLQKMGVKEDVLNNYIGGLNADTVHENFRNNELVKHIHSNEAGENIWNSGSRFRKDDHAYIKANNLNLVDEIFKHGENRKGGYNYLDGTALKALKEAGRLEEFDSMYGRGYDKEKGISSRKMGKFSSADATYLMRQGHTKQEILDDLVDRWHGDKNTKANYHGARWLKNQGLLDEYTRRTRGAGKSGGAEEGTTVAPPTNVVTNDSNQNSTATATTTNTISNNLEQNIGNSGDYINTFGDGNTINNSNIGNNNSTNTGSISLDNQINSTNTANSSNKNSFDLNAFRDRLKGKMNLDQYKTNPYSFSGFDLNKYKNNN